MAKIKFSALVSDVRNKLNGSVASKNRSGNYLRNKTTPVNPQTSYQQAVRQQLGNLSASWRGLTESQRLAWIAATANFPYTDIFGDQKQLDGKSLYVKLNQNILNAGAAIISTPPAAAAIPQIKLFEDYAFEVTAGAITSLMITLSPGTQPAGTKCLVYATPIIPPGQSFVKNKYRFLGPVSIVTAGLDIFNLYLERFGSVATVGAQIYVKVALVNSTTGQLGVPVSNRMVATA